MEYGHDRAVADGVNVDYQIYRIRTRISERGATVEKGYYVDRRDRQTRARRWEQPRRGLDLHGRQGSTATWWPSTRFAPIVRAFKDALFTELFPGRDEVPKTLIFAKDDSTPTTSYKSSARSSARATNSRRRSPTALPVRSPRT